MGCFFCAKRNAKYIRAKQRAFPIRGEGCFVCILVHRETSTSSGEHNFRRKLRSPPSPSQGKALAVPPLRGRWVSRANPDEVEHRASVKIHPQPRNIASPPGSPPAVESGQSKRACCLSYTGGKPFHQLDQLAVARLHAARFAADGVNGGAYLHWKRLRFRRPVHWRQRHGQPQRSAC